MTSCSQGCVVFMILALYFYFLLGPQGAEFRIRLRYFVVVVVFWGGSRVDAHASRHVRNRDDD